MFISLENMKRVFVDDGSEDVKKIRVIKGKEHSKLSPKYGEREEAGGRKGKATWGRGKMTRHRLVKRVTVARKAQRQEVRRDKG